MSKYDYYGAELLPRAKYNLARNSLLSPLINGEIDILQDVLSNPLSFIDVDGEHKVELPLGLDMLFVSVSGHYMQSLEILLKSEILISTISHEDAVNTAMIAWEYCQECLYMLVENEQFRNKITDTTDTLDG